MQSSKIIQDYVITPVVLGKGCFGTVYRGYMKNNKSQLLAVKAIPISSIKNEEIIRRQIEILLKLNNPNIVKFYKPSRTKNHLYFFLEYCQQDLKSYVAGKGGRLSEVQVRDILKQICNGFKEVHRKKIIHRDVKPANFLIHKGVVKIADFGFARVVDSVNEKAILTFLGSPLYMAPQVLAKEEFSSKCDVWSLGVTIYEILYGKTPFTAKNPKELLERLRNEQLTFPQNIKRSEQIKGLLKRMLQVEEKDRISFEELFEHPVIVPPVEKIEESNDSLIQSYRENNNYMVNNKVVGKTGSAAIQQINENEEMGKREAASEGDLDSDVKYQNDKINDYLKVDQIDSLMRYKRNVSVFLNVQCNTFFTQLPEKLPDPLFYMGLYILLRHQIFIHNELKQELSCGKAPEKLTPQIWYQYMKSAAHSRITRLVDCDLKHLNTYFKEVKQRVEKAIHGWEGDKKLVQIFISNFLNVEEKLKIDAYGEILEFLVAAIEKIDLKDRNLITKLKITINPFKYLKEKIDFGLFYEQENEYLEGLRLDYPELKV